MPPFEDRLLVRTSGALASEIDGEVVLISIDKGRYYGLDAIGSEIWKRLESPTTAQALCAELAAAFDGEPAVIARETLAFLQRLSDLDLVQPA